MSHSKKILLIGGTSKVGKAFMDKYRGIYEFVCTYYGGTPTDECSIELNLSSEASIDNFLSQIKETEFEGALFLSSVYNSDASLDNPMNIFSVNVIAYHKILKTLNLKDNSKVFFFTDAGTILPKNNYAFYTMAKDMLKSYIRTYAVENKDMVVLGIDMGPVVTAKTGDAEEKFFSRSPMKYVEKPIEGLCSLLHFVLNEDNFYSTGTVIDFSGGAYLIRNTQDVR